MRFWIKYIAGLCLWVLAWSNQGKSQTTGVEFGQNRVQYHDFIWSYYQSDNFVVYFYLGGQELGKFAALIAEQHLEFIQNKLEYRMNNKIEILVYNNLSDLKQSNIGIGVDEQNTGGMTRIIGTKAFVYFNGSHRDLERQIKEGIAKIFINDMLYGGNIQDVLQNAVLLNLPEWFIDGLVAFIGEEWNGDLDNRLRDGMLSGKYKKFNRISNVDSRFAGHSVWYYISEKYGASAIPNLLYLTRINRSLESGFLFVLGSSVNRTLKDWYQYFYTKYSAEEKQKLLPPDANIVTKRAKAKHFYRELRLNPDGEHIAFVTNHQGKYKVQVLNTNNRKSKIVLRGGFRSITQQADDVYPMLAWDPLGKKLAVIYERKDRLKLLLYDIEAKKKKKTVNAVTKFQGVLDISFMNPQTLVLSGVNKGQSDIYTYHIPSTRMEQITNDFYDDLQPNFIKFENKQGILFLSNRKDDTLRIERLDTLLPTDHLDVFFYDYNKRGGTVVRVTHTANVSERYPMQYSNRYLCYLSDKNGISNRYIAYFDSVFSRYDTVVYYRDSTITNPPDFKNNIVTQKQLIDSIRIYEVYKDTAISFPATNYSRNLLEQDIALKSGKSIELILNNGKFNFYKNILSPNLSRAAAPVLPVTSFRSQIHSAVSQAAAKPGYQQQPFSIQAGDSLPKDTAKIDINNYYFQTEFNYPPPTISQNDSGTIINTEETTVSLTPSAPREKQPVQLSKIRLYRLKFATDYIVTQLDNSLIFNKYQNFAGGGAIFNNPDLNALLKVGISDLFEDYKVVAGFRFPTSFGGGEYFMQFEDLKKRLDKRLIYYRKNGFASYDFSPITHDPVNARLKTNYFQLTLSWPLDILRSLRAHIGYRNDKIIFMSDNPFSRELPNYNEHWVMLKTEYIHDNTIKTGMNLMNGTRYKAFTEYHQKVNDDKGNVAVVGLDFRHYRKVHKQIIWATRLTGNSSFGIGNPEKHRKVVYFLGGVDNWLIPRFNTDAPVSTNSGYAYQALATNLRGFEQNVRNGNSYVLLNSELRIPLFVYLFNKPIRSDFIRNFQLIGFFDAGSAWEGASPFAKNNPFNSVVIDRPPVTVVVNYYRNPMVTGYGLGVRSLIFGYFVRGDLAWGNDNGIKKLPIFHFSLGLDF